MKTLSRTFRALTWLSVLGLGACDPEVQLSTREQARIKLQAVIEKANANMQSPGMVLAVQMGTDEPMILTTGYQDEQHTVPMLPEVKFRVGSITKNFVGMAILQQVQEGKIRMDDTLEKWLPNVFSNIDGKAITIHQMLGHTSGIESYTENDKWSLTVYKEPTHVWNAPAELLKLTEELRAQSIKCGVVVPPGSKFVYSNTDFILLGMIAAKAEGYAATDWEKVIEQRFFKRLQMADTRIPPTLDTSLGSTNHGYVNFYNFYLDPNTNTSACASPMVSPQCRDEDIDFTQQNMTNAWAAGAIISTAKDLLGWINAEVKGDLLSEQIRQEQQTFIPSCKDTPPVTLPAGCSPVPTSCSADVEAGLAIFKQDRYGFIGHRGEIFGFNGTIQYLPSKDLTVVALSNRTALNHLNVGLLPECVAAVLYPDLTPKPGTEAPAVCAGLMN